jgi:hypothetical protein
MCFGHNFEGPSADLRMKEREYIARFYGLDLEALLKGAYEE